MAIGDVLARLAVNLTMETAGFEEGADVVERRLAQSAKRFEQMGSKMQSIGVKLVAAFTAPLAAMGLAAVGVAKTAQEMQNAARLAGEGFEQFQRGAAAAKTVGVEFDKFGDILKDTQDKLGDFAANGGGELQDFFTNIAPKVGVTIDMFRNLSGSQALQLYYDSLVKAGTPQQQMVFYMESIADEGSALIPILANNGKLLKEIGGNAAIISDSDAKGLKEYTDAQARLQNAFQKLQIALAKSGLVEAITAIVDKVAALTTWFADLPAPVQKAGVAMAALAAAAGPVLIGLGAIISSCSTLFAALGTIGTAMTSTGTIAGGLTVGFAALRAATVAFATALGPVGLALGAIGVAVGYLYARQMQADESTRKLNASIAAQSAEIAAARGEQEKAALVTGQMSKEQLKAITTTANLTGQAHLLANAWARVAAEMKGVALADTMKKRNEALRNWMGAAQKYGQKKNIALAAQGPLFTDADRVKALEYAERVSAEERGKAQEARRNLEYWRKQYAEQAAKPLTKPDEPKPYTLPSKGGGKTKGAGASSAHTMASAADQQRELDRLAMEELQAKMALATTAGQREELSRQILAAEKTQRVAEVEANDTFTKDQKAAQIAYLERLYGPKAPEEGEITVQPGLLTQEMEKEFAQARQRLENDMLDRQAAALSAMADVETNTRERARLDAEALAIRHRIQDAMLKEEIATGQVKDAKQAEALLAQQQASDRTRLQRDNMTPMERYQFDLRTSVQNINDAMEGIQVDAMQGLTDGLAGAISGTQKLGEVFKNVAQSIISDLARIAIQKAIVGSIGNALGGLGNVFGIGGRGGGAYLSSSSIAGAGSYDFSAIPGFATGTPSAPRGLALVGERGPELVKFSGGERVYNNADSKKMMGGKEAAPVNVYMSGVMTNDEFWSTVNSVSVGNANTAIAQHGARATRKSTRRLGRR